MKDTLKDASQTGWIADHRRLYLEDGEAGHLWDSTSFGGPGLLPTLLLFTIGRKSGRESIMPLLYGEVGDGYTIIASKGGFSANPGWYHNLLAQDSVRVKVRNEKFDATARVAEGVERECIWAQMTAMYPPFNEYQKSAGDRLIPVVVLTRK